MVGYFDESDVNTFVLSLLIYFKHINLKKMHFLIYENNLDHIFIYITNFQSFFFTNVCLFYTVRPCIPILIQVIQWNRLCFRLVIRFTDGLKLLVPRYDMLVLHLVPMHAKLVLLFT